MKAAVEPLEGNKVKLSVEIDEAEFDEAVDAAVRRIARDVRIPGFRPGKAPRRLVEARIGPDVVRKEALRDALPEYYAQAVRDQDIDVISQPEIEITSGETDGPLVFDAVVEVRPHVAVPGYAGLRVTVPRVEVTEEEVDAQIDRLRAQSGELVAVDRPVQPGDFVTLSMRFTRGDDVLHESDDELYEVGSGQPLPQLDDELRGVRVGDIVQFDAGDGEEAMTIRALVKDVKERLLPEVTDDWAGEASEFDTVEELRADIRRRIELVRRVQANVAVNDETLRALAELVVEEPPEALVEVELQRRANEFQQSIASRGATVEQYLESTGQTADDVVAQLRVQSVESVKADLALRAVAEAEAIDPSDEEIDEYITAIAERNKMKPTQLRAQLEREQRMPAVRSDLKKGKALEWLIDHVEIVDPEGRPVDRAVLRPGAESTEEQASGAEAPGETGAE